MRLLMQRLLQTAVIGMVLLELFGCGFCGFQLRGQFAIPTAFQNLKICPDDRFNAFQRVLRRNLKLNGICVVDPQTKSVNSLSLTSQAFSERNIAYGTDAQVNRVLLQFEVKYQILDPDCQTLCAENTIKVERELVINPNAILGSETERHLVEEELYQDATIQLIRQLSTACVS